MLPGTLSPVWQPSGPWERSQVGLYYYYYEFCGIIRALGFTHIIDNTNPCTSWQSHALGAVPAALGHSSVIQKTWDNIAILVRYMRLIPNGRSIILKVRQGT